MRSIKLEIAAAAALTIGAIISLASGASASDVMVSSAYARASAVSTAKSGVVYMNVMNHGSVADRIVAIRSDGARNAAIHETLTSDGVASMKEIESLSLAPGETRELQPGGLHIMLTGLNGPLKQGSSITVTLVFEKAGEIKVNVPVGEVAAMGVDHSSHTTTTGN